MSKNSLLSVLLVFAVAASFFAYSVNKNKDASVIKNATQSGHAPEGTNANGKPQVPILQGMLPKPKPVTPPNDGFKPTYAPHDNPGSAASEALEAAKNGSAKAMYQLSEAYRNCASADVGTDAEIERKVARMSLGYEGMAKAENRPADQAQLIAASAEEVKRRKLIRDECKTLPESEAKNWQSMLEKSAELGDSRARVDLARAIYDDFKDEKSKVENFDEYSARRNKAFDLLGDTVANGDCNYDVLNAFKVLHQDSVQSYIYESLLWKHALEGDFPGVKTAADAEEQRIELRAILKNLLATLPADQRAAADETSNYLLGNYCRAF